MKHISISVIFILFFVSTDAQNPKLNSDKTNIDSLKLSIRELIVNSDTSDYDSLIEYVINNRRILKDEYASYLQLIRKRAEKDKSYQHLAEIYYRIGVGHRYRHAYDSAKYYYEKALPYAQQNKDDYKEGRIYNELGVVCRKIDRNQEAIHHFLSSIKISDQSDNHYGKAIAENGIGNVYIVQKEYSKALSYFKESLKYGIKSGNKLHLAINYGNVGEAYLYLNAYDSAYIYIQKSLELARTSNNPTSEGICYQLLGELYMSQKKYQKAHGYYEKALLLQRQRSDKFYLSSILVRYGGVCAKLKRYHEAEKNLLEGISLSKNVRSIDNLAFSNEALYEVYYNTNRYKKACDALKLAKIYKDSIFNTETHQVMNDLEYKYQSEKKSQEIELLNTKNQLIGESKKMQRNQFVILLLLLGSLAAFFYYRYQNRQRVTRELQRLNEMKSKFFSNISHEFRTPLTLIKGPVEKQLFQAHTSEERTDLEFILRNSDRLLSLVDQLLNLSKIDAGHFTIAAHEGNLEALLKGISNSFRYQAAEKNINYSIEIDQIGSVWFDRNIVEIIITNLLSNAFKFAPNKGSIIIRAKKTDQQIKIEVNNSGCKLTHKELDRIFDRFYRADGLEKQGTGIGLSLVKELCFLYRMPISVNCSIDQVIKFELNLPTGKDHFNETELALIPPKSESIIINSPDSESGIDTTTENKSAELPVLLIVEDNSDMRQYIRSNFDTKYRILEAEDGEIGIQLALDNIPDLIISDVMMPNIGGVELCNRLKSDIKTSHIPIILLTAKVGDENVVGGLKSGADDYITKPFNAKTLEIKVENLIALRRGLQEKYQKELIISPLNLVFKSEDEKFANTLQDVLDKYLPDPEFSVDQFCKETFMSRTQLHRKLKALTGLSATAFIRTQRVKMAANIMLNPDVNISDVCFSTGFNDTSYFSKCFKEIQGQTPSEYIKKHSKADSLHTS